MSFKVPNLVAPTFRYRARVMVAALVAVTLHGIGIALTGSFKIISESFVGGMLLFVIPVVVGIPIGFKLFDRLFGPDKSGGGLSWSYAKKMAAIVFALSLALYLIQQSKRPVTSTTGTDGQIAVPTAPVPNRVPVSEPTQNTTPVEAQSTVADHAVVATPLSEGLPPDLPGLGGTFETYDREFAIPGDVAPQKPNEPLTGITNLIGPTLPYDEGRLYYWGLLRSGLEDTGLCEHGAFCPVAVKIQLTEWSELRVILVQATFTTPATWNEIVFYGEPGREMGWLKTSTGWRNIGALTYWAAVRPSDVRQEVSPKVNAKAQQTFYKLLSCTYMYDRCKS